MKIPGLTVARSSARAALLAAALCCATTAAHVSVVLAIASFALAGLHSSAQAQAGVAPTQRQIDVCNNGGGDHAQRVSACTAILQSGLYQGPMLGGAYGSRAEAYYQLQDYQHTIADSAEAIRLAPQAPGGYVFRGLAYLGLQDAEHAVLDFTQANRLNPAQAHIINPFLSEALLNRGIASLQEQDWDPAIADFTEALRIYPQGAPQLNPPLAEAYKLRCYSSAEANRELDAARADCNESIRLVPTDTGAIASRAFLGLRQQRWQDAWNDYDASIRMDASHAHFHYGRGVAATHLGRTAEGQADIAAAMRLDASIATSFTQWGLALTPGAATPEPSSAGGGSSSAQSQADVQAQAHADAQARLAAQNNAQAAQQAQREAAEHDRALNQARSRIVAGSGRSASDCVSLVTFANSDARTSGMNRVLINNCPGSVEVFWCYVDGDCNNLAISNTWTLSAGNRWPLSADREVRWGACHGANSGSFEDGSHGLRVVCTGPP